MSADVVTVAPGDVYSAHVGGPHVAATIDVHRPSGRTVEAWTAADEVILGERGKPVSAFRLVRLPSGRWALLAVPDPEPVAPKRRAVPREEARVPFLSPLPAAGGAR